MDADGLCDCDAAEPDNDTREVYTEGSHAMWEGARCVNCDGFICREAEIEWGEWMSGDAP
jgi:hypothetical protein